jgi:hypothetical protein
MPVAQVVRYEYPPAAPRSPDFTVLVDGEAVFVYHTNVADFAAFSASGAIRVEVRFPRGPGYRDEEVAVRPMRHGIVPAILDGKIAFDVPGPMNLLVEIPGVGNPALPGGRRPLLLYVNPLEDPRDTRGPDVIRFAAGKVHEVGDLKLKDHQRVYIEGGAVVRGAIKAESARDLHIAGYGVLDGSYHRTHGKRAQMVVLEGCRDIAIDDLIMIEPTSWMLVLANCEHATVRNVRQIGEVVSSDGIDVVGSRHVLIEDCMLKNNDDCVVIKACNRYGGTSAVNWAADVDDVLVRRCALLNDRAGNAMEIGFETQTESMRNIRFEDCDVLHVHGHGAVFSIHAGDRATIENVVWENIRVEHYYDKLIDFRIVNSRYQKDVAKGHVRNITLRDIHVTNRPPNGGYSVSLIGGLDADHTVENVRLENIRVDGKKVLTPEPLDLYLRNTRGVEFC